MNTENVRPGRSMRPEDLQVINTQLVLGIIHSKPSTMPEIAAVLGQSRPTTMEIIHRLEDDGFILKSSYRPPSNKGGRRTTVYAFNCGARYVVSVSISSRGVIIALSDLCGNIIEQSHRIIDREYSPHDFIDYLSDSVMGYRSTVGQEIIGIGIAVGGQVAPDGLIRFILRFPHWSNVNIVELVQNTLNLPVVVDNDGNLQGLAELYYGQGKGLQDIVCLETGTGVGGSIIIDGKLYRGSMGNAGRFGHVTIDPSGPQCACGKYGCLEVMAGNEFLLQNARTILERNKVSVSLEGLLQEFMAGNMEIQKIVFEAATRYGFFIGNLMRVLNPQRVIIQGDIVKFGYGVLAEIRTIVESLGSQSDSVVFSQLGQLGVLKGAVARITQEVIGIRPNVQESI